MVSWGEALKITASGLGAVFVIMSLLAVITHLFGKVIGRLEKAKKEKK